ncbi:cell wall synthase accessory phosphoprotein MacP [Streptococcus sp. DD13]|uniref:cell wall synthase accessory phosphoprotein MacP n=1 Tax=Streptococcus sp. DD13 TaxID=1777881 RepID=UPI00079A5AFA|nr:cell wall synthase accessory phosphoprotein MacP [Streptococcus sp. DD13]KXT78294.1 hypothetical protein STRDD13_00853 [Streptococcus sp. DD13]
MAKPILTDEIIERSRRNRRNPNQQKPQFGYYSPEDTYPSRRGSYEEDDFYVEEDEYDEDLYGEEEEWLNPREARIQKNNAFRKKVNKLLFWVILLLILLILAIRYL